MSDTLDTAANAFASAIGGNGPSNNDDDNGAPESLFENLGASESDVSAGGDSEDRRKAGDSELPGDTSEVDPFNPFGGEDGDPIEGEGEDDGKGEGEGEDDGKGGGGEEGDEAILDREFQVMVDGQEETVNLREALNGYIRTKTFHQRMNQLDHARTQIEMYAGNLVDDRKRVDSMLAEAEELISGVMPAEPDWDKLFAEDPAAARQLQVQFQQYSNKVVQIRQRREQIAREEAEKRSREVAEYARAELPKFIQNSGFKTKQEMSRSLEGMRKTAFNAGFSEEEVGNVVDSRMLGILLKAAKYDALMANKPRPVKTGKPAQIKPGAASQRGPAQKGPSIARNRRARNDGSVEAATGAFADILK